MCNTFSDKIITLFLIKMMKSDKTVHMVINCGMSIQEQTHMKLLLFLNFPLRFYLL